MANGSHILTARAHDAAGHISESQVSVSVDNDLPPTGSITSPASGAVLSGTIPIAVDAQDDRGVDRVTFYLGNQYITWDGKAPYSINFNTLNFINGDYVLTARIYDTAGNMTITNAVPVHIQN
jgi:beta-glucanase (GH16 family)